MDYGTNINRTKLPRLVYCTRDDNVGFRVARKDTTTICGNCVVDSAWYLGYSRNASLRFQRKSATNAARGFRIIHEISDKSAHGGSFFNSDWYIAHDIHHMDDGHLRRPNKSNSLCGFRVARLVRHKVSKSLTKIKGAAWYSSDDVTNHKVALWEPMDSQSYCMDLGFRVSRRKISPPVTVIEGFAYYSSTIDLDNEHSVSGINPRIPFSDTGFRITKRTNLPKGYAYYSSERSMRLGERFSGIVTLSSPDDKGFRLVKTTLNTGGDEPKHTEMAAYIVPVQDGKVFLLGRKKWLSEGTPFLFPGGGAKGRETPKETAMREFREETKGITLTTSDILRPLMFDSTKWTRSIYFYVLPLPSDFDIGKLTVRDWNKFFGYMWVDVNYPDLEDSALWRLLMPGAKEAIKYLRKAIKK